MVEVNKIYHNDCLSLMSQMPVDFCDLIITSPPYNYGGGSPGNKYDNKIDDKMEMEEYYKWSIRVIDECMRVSKLVCWNIQMIAGNKQAFLKYLGYYHDKIREIIIWDKMTAEPAISDKVLNSEFEFIIVFDKNGGGRRIEQAQFERGTVSNIIRIPKNRQHINSVNHSAMFPGKLPATLMLLYSKQNDIIFDPFVGTGTTCIQAIKYHRQFIGCEIVPEYYDVANKRVKEYFSQLNLFNIFGGLENEESMFL